MLGDFREDLIMGAAGQVLVGQPVVSEVAAAGDDIAHVPVEHGDGGGRVFHKQSQHVLVPLERFFGLFALGDVTCDRDEM